ncbi:hypothetical protein ABZ371_32170, partial [Streptomyces sp. NPDC005899]|uniref:hypothetical protein n=1 Tax=Streptomyces sp. NPDC005899 TaxID=3155716 RepID=UPI0033C1B5D0
RRGFFFPMLSMMDILPGLNPRSRMFVKADQAQSAMLESPFVGCCQQSSWAATQSGSGEMTCAYL